MIIRREAGTGEDPAEEAAVHGLLEGVLPGWVGGYLKGIEKAHPPSSAKYCRIEQSRSRVLLDFFVSSLTYLNALRMQYFTISYLVFRSLRNLRASSVKISCRRG